MSKKQNTSLEKSTNVTTTGKSTICIYKMNDQKISPSQIQRLKAKSFELSINGVKIDIANSVKTIQVTPNGVSINL